jgi:hypothetical protein
MIQKAAEDGTDRLSRNLFGQAEWYNGWRASLRRCLVGEKLTTARTEDWGGAVGESAEIGDRRRDRLFPGPPPAPLLERLGGDRKVRVGPSECTTRQSPWTVGAALSA